MLNDDQLSQSMYGVKCQMRGLKLFARNAEKQARHELEEAVSRRAKLIARKTSADATVLRFMREAQEAAFGRAEDEALNGLEAALRDAAMRQETLVRALRDAEGRLTSRSAPWRKCSTRRSVRKLPLRSRS
jgi:hypothetical protein